jgi:P-type Ca2+ transporter type 2C
MIEPDQVPWHALPAGDVAVRFQTAPEQGLSASEAAQRLDRYGPNQLREAAREPRWRAFLRQSAKTSPPTASRPSAMPRSCSIGSS